MISKNGILSKELFIWHWTLAFTKYTKTRTPQSVVVIEPSTSQQILRSPIGRALDFQAGGRGSIPGAGNSSFFFVPRDLSDPALPGVAGCLRPSVTVFEGHVSEPFPMSHSVPPCFLYVPLGALPFFYACSSALSPIPCSSYGIHYCSLCYFLIFTIHKIHVSGND